MLDTKLLANKGVKRLKATLDAVEMLSCEIVCARSGRYISEAQLKNGDTVMKFRTSRPVSWGRHVPTREEVITDLLFCALDRPDGRFSYGAATSTFWNKFLGWEAYDLPFHKLAYDKMNRKQFCELIAA